MAELNKQKKRDLLTVLRDLSLISAVYLYFIGWTYQFYFYEHFGVSLSALEIPVYYFIIYAFPALTHYFRFTFASLFLVIGGIVIVAFAIVVYSRSADSYRAGMLAFGKWMCVLGLFLLLPGSFYMARKVGEIRSKEIRMGGYSSKSVRIVFKQPVKKSYPRALIVANESGTLKLIMHTKDVYFVFAQPPNATPGSFAVPFGYTYHIPRSDIELITVEMRDFSKLEVTE